MANPVNLLLLPAANPNLPQANWANVDQALNVLGNELQHVPNSNSNLAQQIAVMNQNLVALTNSFNQAVGVLNGFENRFNGLENRFNGLENRFNGLENGINMLNAKFDLLPMRTHNSSALLDAPLRYPGGLAGGGALPETKQDALILNGGQYLQAINTLIPHGIQPIAVHTTDEQKKTRFLEFIGVW